MVSRLPNLALLETDNGTPYFLNLHNGTVAHTLISA
jgi:type IV secretion system protein VirB4